MKLFLTHPESNRSKMNDETPTNLDSLNELTDAVCDSIEVNNILDFIFTKDRNNMLGIIASKLKYNGQISINGNDIHCIATFLENSLMTLDQVNNTLLNGKLSVDSTSSMVTKLETLGLEIVSVSIDGTEYNIIAKRKAPND